MAPPRITGMLGRALWFGVGVLTSIHDALWPFPPRTVTTPAISPRHATHTWDGSPVFDRVMFPGAENPLLDVMPIEEWEELERDALEARDV